MTNETILQDCYFEAIKDINCSEIDIGKPQPSPKEKIMKTCSLCQKATILFTENQGIVICWLCQWKLSSRS